MDAEQDVGVAWRSRPQLIHSHAVNLRRTVNGDAGGKQPDAGREPSESAPATAAAIAYTSGLAWRANYPRRALLQGRDVFASLPGGHARNGQLAGALDFALLTSPGWMPRTTRQHNRHQGIEELQS
jgi:hypothetical protein